MKVPTITPHGLEGLDQAMTVMRDAFDPQFGEAWTAPQCMAIMAMPGAQLFVARNPDVVGFALLRTVLDEAELMLLAVTRQARGAGIGSALLQATIDHAFEQGASAYFLEVRQDNPAVAFYENRGLKRVGVRSQYYRGADGVQRDALTYRKSLR